MKRTVSPIAVGPVTLDIAAGVAHDAAGNGNTAALQAVSDFVSTRPSVNGPSGRAASNNPRQIAAIARPSPKV